MRIKKYQGSKRVRYGYDWHKSYKCGENSIVFKLKDNGDLIGQIVVRDRLILDFVVNPKYRGKGYGKYLLHKAEEEIFTRYDQAVVVPQDNADKLREYYASLGYKSKYNGDEEDYDEANPYCWAMTKEKQ